MGRKRSHKGSARASERGATGGVAGGASASASRSPSTPESASRSPSAPESASRPTPAPKTASRPASASQPGAAVSGSASRSPLAWPHLAALALVLAAAAILYLPTLSQPFFADDYLFLDQVRDRPLARVLVTPDPLSNFYRPISRQLYFWLVSHASGESVAAYHATSIVLFLAVIVLLFTLVLGLAGPEAGLIAAGFVALHYAPDVAVRWASGSQELLAVGFALAAIILHRNGRRWWALIAMVLAMLSKEIVLFAPFVAVALDRKPGERWRAAARRAWPLAIALTIWLLLWIVMPERRAQQGTEVEIDPTGPIAVLAHLVQVTLGAEWRGGEALKPPSVAPPWASLALVLAAIAGAWWWRLRRPAARRAARDAGVLERRPLMWIGLAWAVLGTAPIAAVAILWSAYYYLFAMCGVALVLAVWLAPRPRWALLAIVLLAWTSANARALREFATPRSPWTAQSHINQFYIGRATRYVGRYLEDLKRMFPSFAPGTTLFHSGIQRNVAFQVADGPLVRWAYRDTSLRSYFLSDFSSDKLGRGSVYFFIASGDTLRELPRTEDRLFRIALGLVLNGKTAAARDALQYDREQRGKRSDTAYLLAWVRWELGDRQGTASLLDEAGIKGQAGDAERSVTRALDALQAADTLRALSIADAAVLENGLDSGVHALFADLLLVRDPNQPGAIIEAYAAKVLAPDQPSGWRRWGMVLVHQHRFTQGLAALERYFELGGESAAADSEAQRLAQQVRASLAANVMGGGRAED